MDRALTTRLRRLELTIARRVDGLLHGDHRGLLPGAGRSAGEARPYVPGDDVRRIDWNVTARTQQAYVRDTESDRELEVTLAVDTSASMTFGTALGTKRDAALAVAAVFGFAAVGAGNRVGAVMLGERTRRIAARPGRAHLYGLLGAISRASHDGGVDLGAGLAAIGRTRSRRGLVVVISDFRDHHRWERPLRSLAHRHEVAAAVVTDPRELELPNVGVVRLEDAETGRQAWVDTADRRFRKRFKAAAAAEQRSIDQRIVGAGAHRIRLSTDDDWVGEVIRWVIRRRRVATSAGRSA